jgi:ABC-type dipeptide/oligopeptide/nickel transport system ATPase component
MSSRIIKIHGCSGSGKSTAVRSLMGTNPFPMPIIGMNGKVEAMRISPHIFTLGSYEQACGGVDTIDSADTVMKLIDKYAILGHVVFEGLLQSTYYGRMGAHSVKYGWDYIYAFMDTPIDLCLDRVVARRATSGRNNKFNPELTRDKHRTIDALRRKLEGGTHRVVVLKHDQPMTPQLLELL